MNATAETNAEHNTSVSKSSKSGSTHDNYDFDTYKLDNDIEQCMETETLDGEYSQMSKIAEVNHHHSSHSQDDEKEADIMEEKLLKWGIIRYNWRTLTLTTGALRYHNDQGAVTCVQLDKYTIIYPNSGFDGFVIQNDYKYT